MLVNTFTDETDYKFVLVSIPIKSQVAAGVAAQNKINRIFKEINDTKLNAEKFLKLAVIAESLE